MSGTTLEYNICNVHKELVPRNVEGYTWKFSELGDIQLKYTTTASVSRDLYLEYLSLNILSKHLKDYLLTHILRSINTSNNNIHVFTYDHNTSVIFFFFVANIQLYVDRLKGLIVIPNSVIWDV